jgi:ATP adenylyltransferase
MRKLLYAPWRHDYVTKGSAGACPVDTTSKKSVDCVFCKQFAEDNDEQNFIVKRFMHCALILNRFPYNAGHMMILPFAHKAELHDLDVDVRSEIMEVLTTVMPVVEKSMEAQGFNVGINLGLAGGGGIPAHLHVHVLPRWRGDTNFLETIGNTKVVSSALEQTYQTLKKAFDEIVKTA